MPALAKELREAVLQAAIQGKLTEQSSEDETAEELFIELQKAKKELIKNKAILAKQSTEPFYDEYPFDIPDNWKWVQLSDVSIIQEGAGIRKHQYTKSGTQLLSVTNILDGGIDLKKKEIFVSTEEYKQKYIHLTPQRGDIVTACSGGSWGKVAIFDRDESTMLNTSTLRMRFFKDIANNDYLYTLCKSDFFKNQLTKQLSGMQPNFGYAHYSRICFPLPPLNEQQRIVERIKELIGKIDEYEKIENQLVELQKKFPGEMRDALLQAAMQGKITERHKEDSQIDLKSSNICDYLDYVIFPFDIPDNWHWVKLSDLCSVTGGYAFKSHNYSETGVRVVRISDFNENGFVNSKIVRHSYSETFKQFEIKIKDIIMCMTGGTVGKNLFIEQLEEKMVTNQRVAIIRCKRLLLPEYLNRVINSPFIQDIITQSKNSTNDNISMDTINSFPIPLPPLAEQKRIIDKLDQLLPLCQSLKDN